MSGNALTGGLSNYYLAPVMFPQRKEQPAYIAECEDITEALKMTPDEFCEFKAIWRTAAARLGNGKPGTKAVYDAEKRVHYAGRSLLTEQRAAGIEPKVKEVIAPVKAEATPVGAMPELQSMFQELIEKTALDKSLVKPLINVQPGVSALQLRPVNVEPTDK